MATTVIEKPYIVPSLDGGMQHKVTKLLNQQNEQYIGKNVDLQYKLGGISKALGYSKKGNTINSGAAILGAGSLNTSGGGQNLIAFSGTDAYKFNSGTSAWDAQSRTYTAAQRFEVEKFLDMLFEVNGLTDVPESYNGTSWSTSTNVTDMPKAKYIKEYNSRLYLFHINIPIGGTFPSRVWYSNLPKNNTLSWGLETGSDLGQTATSAVVTSAGSLFKTRGIKAGDTFTITNENNAGEYYVLTVDSETQITLTTALAATETNSNFWVGGNWFDVARDNSDVGRGLGKNGDRLLCFKRFSLAKFQKTTNAATDSLITIKGVPGTTSHRSITNLKKFTFYYSDTGMWRYDSDSSDSILISTPIQEVIDGVTAANKLLVSGWVVGERIVKMFVGDVSNTDTGLTIPKCVICYDAIANAWWVEELSDTIVAAVQMTESDVLENFIFGTGEAFLTESGNSWDGDDINMEIETAFMFPISPEIAVNFTRFVIYGEGISGVSLGVKLAYFDNGRVDQEPRRLSVNKNQATEYRKEFLMDLDSPKASGFKLRLLESSSGTRPVIERIVAYYSAEEQK